MRHRRPYHLGTNMHQDTLRLSPAPSSPSPRMALCATSLSWSWLSRLSVSMTSTSGLDTCSSEMASGTARREGASPYCVPYRGREEGRTGPQVRLGLEDGFRYADAHCKGCLHSAPGCALSDASVHNSGAYTHTRPYLQQVRQHAARQLRSLPDSATQPLPDCLYTNPGPPAAGAPARGRPSGSPAAQPWQSWPGPARRRPGGWSVG